MQPRNQLTTANRLGRTGLVLILAWCATAFPSAALALKSEITHLATDIAVGDFNNDGIDDLVTCGNSDSSSSVDVLLGKANGTFHLPKESSVGSGPGAIALGDFNVDGKLDVATANFGIDGVFNDTISVLLGSGDGTFSNRQDYVVGTPNSIAVADMNGDGFPDLVVGESSNFVVLLGSGDGMFQLANTTHIPSSSNGIAVGDLNDDGKIDVVFTNSVQPYIYTYLGNGDGTFQPRMKSDIDGSRTHPALVDMNADGLPDLVAIEALFPTTLDVYVNKGDGTFDRFPTGFARAREEILDFTQGDFNNDGQTDLAIAGNKNTTGHNALDIAIGNGDGSIFAVFYSSVSTGALVAAGLFNSDSDLDLTGCDGSLPLVRTVYGQGNGAFVTSPRLP